MVQTCPDNDMLTCGNHPRLWPQSGDGWQEQGHSRDMKSPKDAPNKRLVEKQDATIYHLGKSIGNWYIIYIYTHIYTYIHIYIYTYIYIYIIYVYSYINITVWDLSENWHENGYPIPSHDLSPIFPHENVAILWYTLFSDAPQKP